MSELGIEGVVQLCRKALQLTPVSFREELQDAVVSSSFPELNEVLLEISNRAESSRKLRSLVSEIADLSLDINGDENVDVAFGRILSLARQMLGTDAAFIMELDEPSGSASIILSSGIWTTELQEVEPHEKGFFFEIYQVAAPLQVANYLRDDGFEHDPVLDTAIKREGIRSLLGIPVEAESGFQVLFVADRHERIYHTGDIYILEQLAVQVLAVGVRGEESNRHHKEVNSLKTVAEGCREELANSAKALETIETVISMVSDLLTESRVAAFLADNMGVQIHISSLEDFMLDSAGDWLPVDGYAPIESYVRRTSSPGQGEFLSLGEREVYVSPVIRGGKTWGVVVAGLIMSSPETRIIDLVARALSIKDAIGLEADSQRVVESSNLFFTLVSSGREQLTARQQALLTEAEIVEEGLNRLLLFSGDEAGLRLIAQRCSELSKGKLLIGVSTDQVGVLGEASILLSFFETFSKLVDLRRLKVHGYLSEKFTGFHRAAEVYRSCIQFLDDIASLGLSSETGWYTDAALPQSVRLLARMTNAQRKALVDESIGNLLRYDKENSKALVPTMQALFSHHFSASTVAEELDIHVNTVRNRMKRIDEILGEGWNEGVRLLDVQLALAALRIESGTPTVFNDVTWTGSH